MEKIAIQCKGIKKSYGESENRIEALKNIDLDVHQGELTLLVGPSGSGKTTLISIITTILTPDDGQLYLLDQDASAMTDDEKAQFRRKNMGVVFQSLFLIPTLTVLENVTVPLLVDGFDDEAAEAKAMETLTQMNIAHRSHASPAKLSKGQQQRVAIARAIINDSKIVICDEPTSALDQSSGLQIMSILHDLASKSSKAVLVVTHDHRTFPYADRIVNINDGQIISGGT